ncbi:hypothetical protein CVT25_000972 [Psilocybe cyanescens]|uniref:J domain-containing protein n=1 Tax=Psilocybe cyanescens TaxID=93625 RepID=A0A409XMJ5_PSICY|nr:hypothetical protein CVT25_000972 [Psilocybe cyanescens]
MSRSKASILHCRIRELSTTCRRSTHYETLGLHEGASRSQIKSHFYKLSKLHHPDVSKDPSSRALFQKASEAYSVLSNDRDRRAYDRSLLHRAPPRHSHVYHPRPPAARAARASHAWESPARDSQKPPPPDYAYTPRPKRPSTSSTAQGQHYSRPAHIDVLTGTRKRNEDAERELDKIRNEMPLLRPLQVIGAILFGMGVIFGLGR